MISNIHALKGRLETEIRWYKNEKEKLEQLLSDGEENFQETKNKIIQTKTEMKKIISTYSSDLLQELEGKWRPEENKIKIKLSNLEKNKDELESRKRLLDKTLLSHQSSDIFSVGQTLVNTLPYKSFPRIQHGKTKFIPGKIWKFESEVSTTFGELYTVPSLELIDSYETDISIVTKIHCDYNEVVIGSWVDEKLQTVKSKRWNRSTRKFKTLGIHVSTNDQILVGLVESHGLTSPTRYSVRRVVVMNQDGFIQHTYEYDSNSQRLFSWPRRITTHNDNIFVVDLTNKKLVGRVVVLDYEGEIQWTYTGCNSINSNQSKFTPQDIAVSPNGRIVVSDRDNNAVHVLSPTGEVIEYKELKTFGIDIHFSVCINQYDDLWIGCNTMTDKNKAKIFHLKLI
ncbi:uncharacterized protein LOC127731912 [Mytilus californianus]|uniref:uncharacterized protein LOC127731912 n=1 Tax=Mytilus californianus TaxID=6549 RepID=UPI002245C99C|nr:uncharacterized protein LOC127731912 [Mytilus californianus]